MQLHHLFLVVLGIRHTQHVVIVPVRSLPFVETVLFIVIVLFCLVIWVIRLTNETLGVFLVHSCHDLSTNLGLGAFLDGVVLERVFIFFYLAVCTLDITIINSHKSVN